MEPGQYVSVRIEPSGLHMAAKLLGPNLAKPMDVENVAGDEEPYCFSYLRLVANIA
jgi:hypothetical protein